MILFTYFFENGLMGLLSFLDFCWIFFLGFCLDFGGIFGWVLEGILIGFWLDFFFFWIGLKMKNILKFRFFFFSYKITQNKNDYLINNINKDTIKINNFF